MDAPPRKTHYFVIKCNTFQSLGISFDYSVWAVPVHATKRLGDVLNAAYGGSRVVLIASVNGSKAWQGFAEMTSAVSNESQALTFAGNGEAAGADSNSSHMREGYPFSIRWLCRFQKMYINMVSFSQTISMKNELDGGRPLNLSRNLQELDVSSALALCGQLETAVNREAESLQKETAQTEQHFFRSDTEEVSDATWSAFFAEVSCVGRVLYAGHVGSRCYNLHTETSDIDMLVIVAAPTAALLALHPPKDTHKNRAGFKPDFTLHEAGVFAQMLAAGDARMLESLYTDTRAVVADSEEWRQLRVVRDSFVTKEVVRKYISEVHGQKGIKKLATLLEAGEKERAQKHMYIMLRLAMLALQLVRDDTLHLWQDGQVWQHFMDIRSGKFTIEECRAELTNTLAEIEKGLKSSELPDKLPSTDGLDDWLLRIRRKELTIQIPSVPTMLKSVDPVIVPIQRALPITNSHLLFVASGMVVFAASTSAALSLRPLAPGDKNSHFELGRFCMLLEKGNPAAVQLLFVADQEAEFVSSLWAPLRERRDKFVSLKVVQSLAALVRRQASEGAAGCTLLLRHAWRIVAGEGSAMPAATLREEEMVRAIENATSLPQHCDPAEADTWHAQVRLVYMPRSSSLK